MLTLNSPETPFERVPQAPSRTFGAPDYLVRMAITPYRRSKALLVVTLSHTQMQTMGWRVGDKLGLLIARDGSGQAARARLQRVEPDDAGRMLHRSSGRGQSATVALQLPEDMHRLRVAAFEPNFRVDLPRDQEPTLTIDLPSICRPVSDVVPA